MIPLNRGKAPMLSIALEGYVMYPYMSDLQPTHADRDREGENRDTAVIATRKNAGRSVAEALEVCRI